MARNIEETKNKIPPTKLTFNPIPTSLTTTIPASMEPEIKKNIEYIVLNDVQRNLRLSMSLPITPSIGIIPNICPIRKTGPAA